MYCIAYIFPYMMEIIYQVTLTQVVLTISKKAYAIYI